MKKARFKIDYQIYPFNLVVYIGYNNEEVEKHLKRAYALELDDAESVALIMEGEARTIMLKNGGTIMRLVALDKTPLRLGILSHEVFHAVEFLFNSIGMPLTEESDEAYAYMIGYLMEKILENGTK